MDKHILKAEERKLTGRKVKRLRKEGLLPANVYGKKVKSIAITLKESEFLPVYKEAGETGLIELDLGKEKKAVLVANLQHDPVSDRIVHVDLHQVDLKEKVTAEVPVELTGESPAEKQAIGTVVQQIFEIEVEALPTDLPEHFVVDISKLEEVDQAIYVKDLDIDKGKVEVKAELEAIVAKVEPPQKEEVVEPVAAEVPAEGESPAEGATSTEGGEEQPTEGGEEKPQE